VVLADGEQALGRRSTLSHLLAEINTLLARISLPDLEDLITNLKGRAAEGGGSAPRRRRRKTRPRALIVSARSEDAELMADIVESLGHEYDRADSQTAARDFLAGGTYTYVLLDLCIPVRPRRNRARLQNGVNLLGEIRADSGLATVPVITMLLEEHRDTDLAVWMMRNGAADFLAEPFNDRGYTLEKAINDALARAHGKRPTAAWPTTPERKKKRGTRAAAIEAIKDELVQHIRAARDHAFDAMDRSDAPALLPRPQKKELARRLGLKPHTVTRCFRDSPELRTLWDIAADIRQVMRFGG